MLDLLWAQWPELGVPGVVRGDPHTAVDMKWLLVHPSAAGWTTALVRDTTVRRGR